VIAASEILYPPTSVGNGIVIFDVSIDDKGSLTGSTPVRTVPSLTEVASNAIRTWRFAPAESQGVAAPSLLRIVVVFRPPAYFVSEPAFEPLPPLEKVSPDEASTLAPGILSAAYPKYPVEARQGGTVVLRLVVAPNGRIAKVKVVRPAHPFTRPSLAALSQWRLQGTDTEMSDIVIAFSFTPPVNTR
jgi:TonB family protein